MLQQIAHKSCTENWLTETIMDENIHDVNTETSLYFAGYN